MERGREEGRLESECSAGLALLSSFRQGAREAQEPGPSDW